LSQLPEVVWCGKYNSGHFAAQKRFIKYGMVSADVQNERQKF